MNITDRADTLLIGRARRFGLTALAMLDARPTDPVVAFWKRVNS